MPPRVFIDFETRSEVDLETVGTHNYAAHPSTRILMLGWALNNREVSVWEPHVEPIDSTLAYLLLDEGTTKVAFNAAFERDIFKFVLGLDIPLEQWEDPMVQARMLSMPGALGKVCKILGLSEDFAKNEAGKDLINLFCTPASLGGEQTLFGMTEPWFSDWNSHPREWEAFKQYCRQDVIATREIVKKSIKFPLPESERKGWILDRQINDRGIPVDLPLVRGAVEVAEAHKALLIKQNKDITGLENPNSNVQFLKWAQDRGYGFNALAKPLVTRALGGEVKLTPECRKAILIRQQASKNSDSKFPTILNQVSADGRLRNQFSYLGAVKTGRWASYGVQLANLPRPTKEVEKSMDRAIELLRNADQLGLILEFPNVMEVVASCVRPAFRAPAGSRFLIADLSAIENRIVGWLSGCQAILDVFRSGRDPYLDFACHLYGREYTELAAAYADGDPIAKELRFQSKPATLGCGYRLGGGEEILDENNDRVKTGLLGYAASMGVILTKKEAERCVAIFREKFPEIVSMWYALEDAAFYCLRTGETQTVGFLTFEVFGRKLLRMSLPSGRALHYIHPTIETVPFRDYEKETLHYEGLSKKKQWTKLPTHGGRLLENATQAVARDILLNGMMEADKEGFCIVGHVHDEILAETPFSSSLTLAGLINCMSRQPAWAPGLPLGAAGFESEYYKKG